MHNTVRSFGESATNNNGLKIINFATYNNVKMMNLFYEHKNIQTYTWSACNYKTVIDYFITNWRLSKPFLDARV
jgi:hypothetical protein